MLAVNIDIVETLLIYWSFVLNYAIQLQAKRAIWQRRHMLPAPRGLSPDIVLKVWTRLERLSLYDARQGLRTYSAAQSRRRRLRAPAGAPALGDTSLRWV